GLVAASGLSGQSVITTPNMTWVPQFAVAHSEISTYLDGRWHRHEYSRWPQEFAREIFHIHCIPSKPRPSGPRDILWRTFCKNDWKVDNCGVPGVGFLTPKLQDELANEADAAVWRYLEHSNTDWHKMGKFLVLCLRHTVDRLRKIPAPPNVIICLAAHIQRLTLELYGLIEWLDEVLDRVKDNLDLSHDVLEVLGAHTSDASVAQMLHRAGIPVWYQQTLTTRVVVYDIVTPTDVPDDFSTTPCVPRLVLAKRDLSGALNMSGEWQRAMAEVVRRQLLEAQLPELLDAEADGSLPPAKRLREGAAFFGADSSSVGPAKPAFIVKGAKDIRAIGHDLPPAPTPTPREPSRRAQARKLKRSADLTPAAEDADVRASTTRAPGKSQLNPLRQYYPSRTVQASQAWANALAQASPLPPPQRSGKYFFPPPWLLDSIEGIDSNPLKTARYLHHWCSIRHFCNIRLFDSSVQGRPMTILEWRSALWGDYDAAYEIDTAVASDPPTNQPRINYRRELRRHVHALFGKVARLPSYEVDKESRFGDLVATIATAANDSVLRARGITDVHETNWRCELLAIDAHMVDSKSWSIGQRWARELLVSQVWGPGTSGLDITPAADRSLAFCWAEPYEEGWEECRPHLQAFVEVLSTWPDAPEWLRAAMTIIRTCDGDEYARILSSAVSHYVQLFVKKYERLPVPPVRVARVLSD
ncbi:hypothetical protein C8Q76DRAFT_624512, partial [Earliella scabrosa]